MAAIFPGLNVLTRNGIGLGQVMAFCTAKLANIMAFDALAT